MADPNTYQKFSFDEQGALKTYTHTHAKRVLVEKAASFMIHDEKDQQKKLSVLDIGSAEGILSFCLLDRFPEKDFDLVQVNPTQKETDIAKSIFEKRYAPRHTDTLTILPGYFADIPIQKYDLVLFFAIFHHLLHTYENANKAMEHLAQFVGSYAVIEVPLKGDALLDIWMNKNPTVDYSCLESLQAFEHLILSHFELVFMDQVQYSQENQPSDLNRWGFIVRKKCFRADAN